MERTPEATVGKIKLKRSEPKHNGKSFLIVEGDDDKDFFRKFLDSDENEIEHCRGKDNVIKIIKSSNEQKIQGVLGVIDVDHDYLNNCFVSELNLLYTDFRDIENMLFFCKGYELFIITLLPKNIDELLKINLAKEIRNLIYSLALPIGVLRYLSERNKLFLYLKDYLKYIIENKEFDLDNLIYDGFYCSAKKEPDKDKVSNLKKEMVDFLLNIKKDDEYFICKGKDILEITAKIIPYKLEEVYRKRNIKFNFDAHKFDVATKEGILRQLIPYYDSMYFRETNLYKSIRDWEEKNKPYRILDEKI